MTPIDGSRRGTASRLALVIIVVEAVLVAGIAVGSVSHGGGVGGVVFGLSLGVSAAVGWLVAARVPRHPIGWLLLAFAGLFLLFFPALVLGQQLVHSHPTAAAWLLWYGGDGDNGWSWLPPVGLLFTAVLLLFPDGHLPSPRWRWFAVAAMTVLGLSTVALATGYPEVAPGLANPVFLPWVAARSGWLVPALGLPLLTCFAVSAGSLVVRNRRADPVTRTQIRWVAWAATVVVGLYVVSFASPSDALGLVNQVSYCLIPVAIGVAVLRYRLYDIDRILSRTVSYGLVTAAALATYAVVVTSVSRVLPVSSGLAVAAATLAAAAVFRPVLGRTQRLVDRRFDRVRYDGERTVDAFGASLRHQVDPQAVATELVRVVRGTVSPQSVGLVVFREPA